VVQQTLVSKVVRPVGYDLLIIVGSIPPSRRIQEIKKRQAILWVERRGGF
jgi:hypothetical protein